MCIRDRYWGGRKRLEALGQVEVRLVQWQSIGFDGVDRFLPAGLLLANATSVHETSTAELAVGLAITAQRGLPAVSYTHLDVYKRQTLCLTPRRPPGRPPWKH